MSQIWSQKWRTFLGKLQFNSDYPHPPDRSTRVIISHSGQDIQAKSGHLSQLQLISKAPGRTCHSSQLWTVKGHDITSQPILSIMWASHPRRMALNTKHDTLLIVRSLSEHSRSVVHESTTRYKRTTEKEDQATRQLEHPRDTSALSTYARPQSIIWTDALMCSLEAGGSNMLLQFMAKYP